MPWFQHQHDGVLSHGHGVGTAIGTNRDPGRSRPRDIHGIVARAQHLHHFQPRGIGQRFVRNKAQKPQQIRCILNRRANLLSARAGRQMVQGQALRLQALRQRLNVRWHFDSLGKHDFFVGHERSP